MDSALYASAFCFGKRTAIGVQGAQPFAHAMSKTLPKCALAFRFEPLIFNRQQLYGYVKERIRQHP